MATETKCPHCGKPVPATALEGICPECMLQAGLAETGEVGPGGMAASKPTRPVPTVEEITPHFPQLEILKCLGRGGMGVVYKARQPKLDRFVALKILTRSRDRGISDTEFAARFQQEARALARLSHPDIVAVYDFGEAGGFHYLLMEYVDGLTLRQLLQRKKLSPEEALTIVPKICEALQFAHQRGIVHRDIKPENILLDKEGRVKIADFGIAKILGAQAAGGSLTGVKDVIGTPHYMAPEQIEKPARVDHRADIYSLGVVFYEMLTGELPLGRFAPPSRKVHVDVRLDEVVLHALEKEPERRYQHASEVKTDVETIAASPGRHVPDEKSSIPAAASEGTFRRWFAPLVVVREGRRVVHWPGVAQDAFMLAGIYCVAWLLVVTSLSPVMGTLHAGHLLGGLLGFLIAMLAFGFYRSFKAPVEQLKKLELPPTESFTAAGRTRGALQSLLAAMLLIAALGGWVLYGFWVYVQPLIVERVAAQDTALTSGQRAMFQLGSLARGHDWLLLPILVLVTVTALLWLILPGSHKAVRLSGAARHAARAWLSRRTAGSRAGASAWVSGVRWTARILGTLLLAFYAFFILNEGLPPMASQPEGVQLNFVALALMLLGFVTGWKREGAAALLIASGWTLWHISESRMQWNVFQTPLPVAVLYGFCWWALYGRRTRAVVMAVVTLVVCLGLGRLFVPTSVFVRGMILDGQSGKPIPNAELRILPRPPHSFEESDPPNARANADGQFTLYIGWYESYRKLAISATGYGMVTTNLGPRGLGQREVRRDFSLLPALHSLDAADGTVPPVVVRTEPESGAADVNPALNEIRVTFSEPMQDGSWSWTKCDEENFPELSGAPKFLDDQRTCVLPVRLRPGQVYAIWLNSDYHHHFKDQHGQPAVPYLLVFETRK